MSLGRRLALPLTVVLLLAQALAGFAIHAAVRAAVLDDARGQLAATTEQITRLVGATHQPAAALVRGTGLVVANDSGGWTLEAGDIGQALISHLPSPGTPLPHDATVVKAGGAEIALQATMLPAAAGQPPTLAVASLDLSQRMRRYDTVWGAFCAVTVLMLLGALAIIRWLDSAVARPIGELTARIIRIGQGDYTVPDAQPHDALGQRLSVALTNMTRALADREYQIREMVLHEPVTHLPNRAAFLDEVAPQLGAERAAVLMIGLVHAQEIANTVDREVADRVLRNVAARLGHLLGDVPLACLSDRAFAVFLGNVGELRARSIAARIVAQFDVPYSDDALTIDTATAVGISLMPAHGEEAALLLRRAEVALQAGLRAEHRWAVYDHGTDSHRPERLSLMSDLRQGLVRGEFMLVYQPKLHVASGRVTSAEALIRWHHPKRGMVPPDAFISMAEDTGNIGHLTRWALRSGIEQAAQWRAEGIDLQIAINVSARDLGDARLPNRIVQLLDEHGLGRDAISLEVTESTIMINPTAAIAVLQRLADENIAVSVDDFGVGRASLAYLRTLPVRELKIDRAFVQRVVEDENDRKIIRSVVQLGHSLGFGVAVEGVEDAATLRVVSELGCDYVQGYFVARPLVPEMLVRFIQQPPPMVPA